MNGVNAASAVSKFQCSLSVDEIGEATIFGAIKGLSQSIRRQNGGWNLWGVVAFDEEETRGFVTWDLEVATTTGDVDGVIGDAKACDASSFFFVILVIRPYIFASISSSGKGATINMCARR